MLPGPSIAAAGRPSSAMTPAWSRARNQGPWMPAAARWIVPRAVVEAKAAQVAARAHLLPLPRARARARARPQILRLTPEVGAVCGNPARRFCSGARSDVRPYRDQLSRRVLSSIKSPISWVTLAETAPRADNDCLTTPILLPERDPQKEIVFCKNCCLPPSLLQRS